MQNPQWREENHNHERGICDMQANVVECYTWSGRGCCYWANDLGNQHIWARGRHEQVYRKEANGHARTTLRSQLRIMMKMSRKDLEDGDFQTFPHRHQALWDSE